MSDELSPIRTSERDESPATPGRRLTDLWHRIRSGEDPAAFGAVVLITALIGGVVWFWAGARSGGVPAASAAPGRASPDANGAATVQGALSTTTTSPPLAVHVAGAVARPGLYRLPAGARVADALAVAGGKLPRADLDRLNLAAKLVDGQKVLVTRRGELVPVEITAEGAAGAVETTAGPEGATAGGARQPVDLNSADLAALDSLPGIGPATARAILEERTRRGGFRSPRDLLRVPGIGEGRFARLKDLVRV